MALANKGQHMQNESAAMAIIQASAFYDQDFGRPSLLHTSSNSSPEDHIYGFREPVYREPESPEKAVKNFTMSNSSTVSSPSSTNSNGGLGFHQPTAYSTTVAEEGHSVINFKPQFGNLIHASAGSLLSFDQTKRVAIHRNLSPKMMGEEDDYPMWEAADQHLHYQSQLGAKCTAMPETSSSHHDTAAEYDSSGGGAQWAWLNNDHEANNGVANGGEEMGGQEIATNKRQSTGENLQTVKKQCVAATKKAKPKSAAESKDPQSVAAKNRRERIGERLKTLQELVPNGSKVDLVTMLEKAISYVKFLQLQVKVLATDEFWPAQGGKAPDLSQVREAIDAILASQRDRNSSSK